MKSIKQWMSEKGMLSEEFDKVSMAKYFGSSTVDVDPTLRAELKQKIIRIVDLRKELPRDQVLDRIKAVISKLVSGASGNRLNSRSLADKLSDDENKVNKNRFADMMGADSVEVDPLIKRELEPKIDHIMMIEDPETKKKIYGDMPKSELEAKLIAVASQVVAEMGGGTMSLSGLSRKMDSFEQEPIARESTSLPSFLTWIEENQDGSAVSEPQHEEGEDDMDLKALVEKRMMELAQKIEQEGKGSRKDVLEAMKAVISSAEKDSSGGQEDSSDGQQAPSGDQQMAPQGDPQGQQMAPQA